MSCSLSLEEFIQRYINDYQTSLGDLPQYYFMGEQSPCCEKIVAEDIASGWQLVVRDNPGKFDNVAAALNLELHSEIDAFYGQYFAAPMLFDSPWGQGELLQVYSEDDFEYLQKNIIGHLMMKQKLKQPLTWFIGVIGDDEQMVTVNNDDGSVWIEVPGEIQSVRLADSLSLFIDELSVVIAPPVMHQSHSPTHYEHPGIIERMKIMWRNLRGRA